MNLLLMCLLAFANDGQEITLKQIMADPIWMGEIPSNVKFDDRGEVIYFQVPRPIPLPPQWMKLVLEDGRVELASQSDLPYTLATDTKEAGSLRVHRVNGDLWVSHHSGTGADEGRKVLLSRKAPLSFVRMSAEGALVFREAGQLHLLNLKTGQMRQLTDLRFEEEEEDEETLYSREERKMFTYVEHLHQLEVFQDEQQEAHLQVGSLKRPNPIYLGKDLRLGSSWIARDNRHMLDISPDLKRIAITVRPDEEGESSTYAEFINKKGEVTAKKARPKVGMETDTWKFGLWSEADGQLKWLDLGGLPQVKLDRLADIKEALSEEDRKFLPKDSEDPRPLMLIPGGFSSDGSQFLLTAFSRDYKDKWILLVDPETLNWTVVDHHFDEAWVQYIMRNIGTSDHRAGAAFWGHGGEDVFFLSDKSGYQHLYRYDPKKKKVKALTKGKFEVHHPFLSQDGKRWFFHSNRQHPGEWHFYSMPAKGGKWVRQTSEPGFHRVEVSPDEGMMVDLFSETNRPPVLRVKRGSGSWQTVYDGRSEAFKAIPWMKPQVLSYKNRDGSKVFARLYQPERPNGAGVVFVHGAGYLQNAHKGWSGYFREFMFHNLLAREGYVVLDPDYQGSAGYGRDWRTAIYRHMGGKDLTDVVDGAAYLNKTQGVDAKRIGVYGGSYGGFITFMAMFTQPQVFAAGAALRPVTDWAYYNHWYTARILNTPQIDPEAYRRSSPIYFADGLQGDLLICHGMVDSNVQYQDVVRLSQKLIELGKTGWEMASYPVEGHGFRTPSAWHDEYRRIWELFQESLSGK